jgi:hypothetical protein
MGKFSFGEERIGPTYVKILHMHVHDWVEPEKQIEETWS